MVSCRPRISYCICIACAQLQSLYHGIPKSVVEKFVFLCPSCQLRKPQLSTAKPIIANGFFLFFSQFAIASIFGNTSWYVCIDCGHCSTDPFGSVHSTPRATRNLSFLAIRRFEHYYIASGKWRFRRIYTVIPVFEQAKPVLIAAVSLLICMILNLVHH